jgi:hypothetical protein
MDRIDHGPIIFPRIDGLDIAICDGSIMDRIDHGPIILPRIDGLDIAICDGSPRWLPRMASDMTYPLRA